MQNYRGNEPEGAKLQYSTVLCGGRSVHQGFRYPILVEGGGRIQRKSANFGVFQQKSAYFATLVGGG